MKLILIILASSMFVRSSAQKVDIYVSKEGQSNTLIESVYFKRGKPSFIKLDKGEVNKIVYCPYYIMDTLFFELKNYRNLINLKYYNINNFRNCTLLFRLQDDNRLMVKFLNDGKETNYIYYRTEIKQNLKVQ